MIQGRVLVIVERAGLQGECTLHSSQEIEYCESVRISSGRSGWGCSSMALMMACGMQISIENPLFSAEDKKRLTNNSPRLFVCKTPGRASAKFLLRYKNSSTLSTVNPVTPAISPILTSSRPPRPYPKRPPTQLSLPVSHSLMNCHHSRLRGTLLKRPYSLLLLPGTRQQIVRGRSSGPF